MNKVLIIDDDKELCALMSTLDNSSNSIKRMKEHFIKLSDNIEELRTKYA